MGRRKPGATRAHLGRPPKPLEELRSGRVLLVLTPAELSACQDAAKAMGLTPAQWARGVVLEWLAHRLLADQVKAGTIDDSTAALRYAMVMEPEQVFVAQPVPPPPLRARTVPVRPMGERCPQCGASASYRVRPSSGKLEACCAPCRAWL